MKKLLLVLLFLPLVCFGQSAEDLIESGKEKANLKDYYGAIVDYTKAIELKPDYADTYNNRGSSKYSLDDLNGACADFRKAISLGSTQNIEAVRNNCN